MLNSFLTSWGNEFQSLGAEQENVSLYSEVRANGVYKVPFFLTVDLMCARDIGVSIFVM